MAGQRTPRFQRMISGMLDARTPGDMLKYAQKLTKETLHGGLCVTNLALEHRGLAALRGLLMTPVDCPVSAAIAACFLISGLDDAMITPGPVRPMLQGLVTQAGCVPPVTELFVKGIGNQRLPEGRASSDMSGTAIAGAALGALLLRDVGACEQALAVEGFVQRLCQLLRGDEPDAKARFFAAGQLVMIARTFVDEKEPLPPSLLQTVKPLLRVLGARRGARVIPGSVNERTVATAAMALSQMSNFPDFAMEIFEAGGVKNPGVIHHAAARRAGGNALHHSHSATIRAGVDGNGAAIACGSG